MLKKNLWIKNIVFLCFFALIAAQIGNQIIIKRLPEDPLTGSSIIPQSSSARNIPLRKNLAFYKVISERNIFNSEDTGENATTASGTRAGSSAPLTPTELNVQLIGTVVGAPESSFAIVQDQKTKKQELFQLDDIIQDVARVLKISRCQVVVLREGAEEILECPEEDSPDRSAGSKVSFNRATAASDSGDSVRKVSESEYLIDEMEVENALNNINQLMTQIRVVPNFKDGKTNGFKVFAIKPKSIFSKIGLKNGDVIQRINDQDITTPDKAFQAFNQLRNEKSLNVDILRRGGKQSLKYEIR